MLLVSMFLVIIAVALTLIATTLSANANAYPPFLRSVEEKGKQLNLTSKQRSVILRQARQDSPDARQDYSVTTEEGGTVNINFDEE